MTNLLRTTLLLFNILLLTLVSFQQITLAQPPPSLMWAIRPEAVSGPDTPTETGAAIAHDGSGNVYVTGIFFNTVNFGPGNSVTSSGNSDVYIANYTSAGSLIWVKSVGGTTADVVRGITVDGAGNVYITGQFTGTADFDPGAGTQNRSSSSTADNDIFIAKYDNAGNYQWVNALGSTGSDAGYSLAVDAAGNLLATGHFSGTVDFDPGAGNTNLTGQAIPVITGFVAQYTSGGSLNWAKAFGGPTATIGFSVDTDASNNVYLTGYFTTNADFDQGVAGGEITGASAGVPDGFVAKYSSAGTYGYAKPFGGSQTDIGFSIVVDGPGNAFVTGYFANDADFDPANAGGNLTGGTGFNGFLAKYDANGTYVSARSINTESTVQPVAIALDGSGNCYLTGYFSGDADFDPGNTQNRSSAGNNDLFLAKFNSSGNYVYAKAIGGTGDDRSNALAVDAVGSVVITGQFEDIVDFDPNAGITSLTATEGADLFIAQYAELTSVSISPAGPIAVCMGSPLILTAIPTGIATMYTWSSSPLGISGNGAVLNTVAPIVAMPTNYTVTVTASDGSATVSNTVIITVSNQLPPILDLAASGVLGTGNCAVKLTATATGRAFVFTGPNVTSPTDYVFSNVYRNRGQYPVYAVDVKKPGVYRLTAYDGNCSTFAEVTVLGTDCP